MLQAPPGTDPRASSLKPWSCERGARIRRARCQSPTRSRNFTMLTIRPCSSAILNIMLSIFSCLMTRSKSFRAGHYWRFRYQRKFDNPHRSPSGRWRPLQERAQQPRGSGSAHDLLAGEGRAILRDRKASLHDVIVRENGASVRRARLSRRCQRSGHSPTLRHAGPRERVPTRRSVMPAIATTLP